MFPPVLLTVVADACCSAAAWLQVKRLPWAVYTHRYAEGSIDGLTQELRRRGWGTAAVLIESSGAGGRLMVDAGPAPSPLQ